MVSVLEVFQASVWTDAALQERLWDDNNITDCTTKDNDLSEELSPIANLLQSTPFSFLSSYDSWLIDVMKCCENISYQDVFRCIGNQTEGVCLFLKCLKPEFDVQDCLDQGTLYQLMYFAETMCTYEYCAFNIPLPFPPKLRSIRSNNFAKYTDHKVHSVADSHDPLIVPSLCFRQNNSLEIADLPNLNSYFPQTIPGVFNIYGFRKLRFLNFQGHKIPFPLSRVVVHDMESLTELHVGGNSITHDNILPVDFLHTTHSYQPLIYPVHIWKKFNLMLL